MSLSKVYEIVKERFDNEWTETPIIFDNIGAFVRKSPEFIKVKITGTPGEGISKNCQRESFLISIYVNTSKDTGYYKNSQYCDSISGLFYNYLNGLLTCRNTWIERVGQYQNRYKQVVFINVTYHQHY